MRLYIPIYVVELVLVNEKQTFGYKTCAKYEASCLRKLLVTPWPLVQKSFQLVGSGDKIFSGQVTFVYEHFSFTQCFLLRASAHGAKNFRVGANWARSKKHCAKRINKKFVNFTSWMRRRRSTNFAH